MQFPNNPVFFLSASLKRIVKWSDMVTFSDFLQLHLSSRYFGRWIFDRLQYIGARAPLYWSSGSIILEPLKNRTSEHNFVTHWKSFAELNKPNSDGLSLIKPHLCNSKGIFLTYKSILQDKYLICSNILEPGLHYIGARAPLYWSLGSNKLEPLWFKKHVFCFIFEHETRQTKGF